MKENKNIGEWNASIEQSGANIQIVVRGTFPTNGERPRFHLEKNDPQGINETELILTLVFGNLVDPDGRSSASVYYEEIISNGGKYKTVLVVSGNRVIAHLDV